MDQLKKILNFAMRMEKDAGEFYSFYMDKVQSASTKELFSGLVKTEKEHYNFIKKKYDELGYEEPPITISWVVDNQAIEKNPSIFADNADIVGDGEISDLMVIRMAYLIENDFAEFYTNAAKSVDNPDVKKFLEELAGWENQHRDMFYARYQELLKKYWADIESIIFA